MPHIIPILFMNHRYCHLVIVGDGPAHDQQLHQEMSLAAVLQAQKHSWYEAMEKLVQGYQEVIEAAKTPVAA